MAYPYLSGRHQSQRDSGPHESFETSLERILLTALLTIAVLAMAYFMSDWVLDSMAQTAGAIDVAINPVEAAEPVPTSVPKAIPLDLRLK